MNVYKREYFDIRLTKKEADMLRLILQKLPHSTIMRKEYDLHYAETNLIDSLHDELIKSR